jgi:hypothetical protein
MDSFGWCSTSDCRSFREEAYSTPNNTNASNFSCPTYPFCVLVLTTTIDRTNVRIFDLLLVFGNAVFLLVLFVHMVPTVRKLSRSLPLFKILYSLVFLIPGISLVHGLVSMSLGYHDLSSKVTHVVVRGSILMTEMCVIVFGLFFSELSTFTYT